MTEKPQLILHIGMGKTGTTALQETFWANRGPLERAGITYPTIGAVSAAHHLISPYVPKVLAGNGWTFRAVDDWAPKLVKSGAKRILMSSELIAWASPGLATSFCQSLQPYFDLKICLYVRRQDNIMMAAYNQQIKAGNQTNPIEKNLEQLIKSFDFAATIATWEAAVGTQNMIVRPYERAQFPGGDLIADFVTHVLGIAMPEDFKPLAKDNSNPRFSYVALEYKRLINCVCGNVAASGVYTPALSEFSKQHDAGASAVFSEQGLLSVELRQKILTHFAAQNAEIAARFLGKEVLFTEELSKDALSAPEVTGQDLKSVSDWLMANHKGLAEHLIEAAKKAQAQERPVIKRAGVALLRAFGQEAPGRGAKPVARPAAASAKPPSNSLRVIIHPGLPKTGTTSIQEAFFKNRAALLRDHGILYPGLDENHTQPILGLFREDALVNVRFAGMNEAGLARYKTEVRSKVEAEIKAAGWHTLLISGEGISTLKAEGWRAFVDWLQGLGLTRIEVIFGLRDGMDLVRSTIQQNIKTGLLLEDQYKTPPVMRARARLAPIIATLGKAQISIWDFDDARAAPGGLLHHFCASLDLEPAVCQLIAQTPVFQNESMTQTGVDALAERNRNLGKRVGVSGAEQTHFLALEGPKYRLPDEVSERVKVAIGQDADWMAKVFPKSAQTKSSLKKVTAETLDQPKLPAPAPVSLGTKALHFAVRVRALARDLVRPPVPRASVVAKSAERIAFVHFGGHKTGSSSIQQSLFDSAGSLQNAAYVHATTANSSLLVQRAILGRVPQSVRLGRTEKVDDEAAIRADGRAILTVALNKAGKTANRIILSAEAIAHFKVSDLQDLAEMIAPFAKNVVYVGYVRDPVSYGTSVFQQVLQTSLPTLKIFDKGADRKLTHHLVVDRLDSLVGRQNVRAFPFDRDLFPEGDVVRHFMQVTGINPAEVTVQRVNERLSLLAIKVLFIYRSLTAPKEGASVLSHGRQEFNAAFAELKGPDFNFHPDVKRRIEQANQHIYDWAEERLGWPLPRPDLKSEGGILHASELLTLSREEWVQFVAFAEKFGVTNLPRDATCEDVAAAMQRIRLSFGAKGSAKN